jgi:hypothetical protein
VQFQMDLTFCMFTSGGLVRQVGNPSDTRTQSGHCLGSLCKEHNQRKVHLLMGPPLLGCSPVIPHLPRHWASFSLWSELSVIHYLKEFHQLSPQPRWRSTFPILLTLCLKNTRAHTHPCSHTHPSIFSRCETRGV